MICEDWNNIWVGAESAFGLSGGVKDFSKKVLGLNEEKWMMQLEIS